MYLITTFCRLCRCPSLLLKDVRYVELLVGSCNNGLFDVWTVESIGVYDILILPFPRNFNQFNLYFHFTVSV